MTDPATYDVHPLYHLINLAQSVSDAEAELEDIIRIVRSNLDQAERDLARGTSHNRLGILQAQANVDRPVARLEQAAEALRSGYNYLGDALKAAREVTDPTVQFAPGVIELVKWLDTILKSSPRAAAIMGGGR